MLRCSGADGFSQLFKVRRQSHRTVWVAPRLPDQEPTQCVPGSGKIALENLPLSHKHVGTLVRSARLPSTAGNLSSNWDGATTNSLTNSVLPAAFGSVPDWNSCKQRSSSRCFTCDGWHLIMMASTKNDDRNQGDCCHYQSHHHPQSPHSSSMDTLWNDHSTKCTPHFEGRGRSWMALFW